MAKKVYQKPELQSEAFMPQTYVAACGDHGAVYKFNCDAPAGNLYYFKNSPASGAFPSNTRNASLLGSYHPCNKYHEADSQSGFYWGFVDYDYDGRYSGENEKVIVWRGANGRNGHATQKIKMSEWETVKS